MLCPLVSFDRRVEAEVEDGRDPCGPEELCLVESDAESCGPPFIGCSRRLCAEAECQAVGPGQVPDAAFSVAKRVGEGLYFVRVCGEIKELRPLSSSALYVIPAALFQLPHLHRRTCQLPPFTLPCLGLLCISSLSLHTSTH